MRFCGFVIKELHFLGYCAMVPIVLSQFNGSIFKGQVSNGSSLHIQSSKKSLPYCLEMSCTFHPGMQCIIQEEWRPKM